MSESYQSELSYKEMLNLCQTNKDLSIKWLTHLFKKYMPNIEKITIERPLISIMGFTPLPYSFQTNYFADVDKVVVENKCYKFIGQPGDRIMFANRRVPFQDCDAIPFTFPIKKKNNIKLYQSNIFYFEVELLKNNHRESWDKECLSIGYGTEKTIYKNQVGWTKTSWGFHSDDGCYMSGNNSQTYSCPWEKGDIVGVGLKYLGNYNYAIFLTKNGIIAGEEKIFNTDEKLYPMLGIDISFPIKVNFGEDEFNFDLECHINSNEIINIKNTFLLNKKDVNTYTYTPSTIINYTKKINIVGGINKNGIYDVPKSIWNKIFDMKPTTNDISNQLINDLSYNNISNNLNTINSLNNNYMNFINSGNVYSPKFNYLKVNSLNNVGYIFSPLSNINIYQNPFLSNLIYDSSLNITQPYYDASMNTINSYFDVSMNYQDLSTNITQTYYDASMNYQDMSMNIITQQPYIDMSMNIIAQIPTYLDQQILVPQIIMSLLSELNSDETMEESDVSDVTDNYPNTEDEN